MRHADRSSFDEIFDSIIDNAKKSQQVFQSVDDETIDCVLDGIANYAKENLHRLAADEVASTGLGNAAHKEHKLLLVCRDVVEQLKPVKSFGRLEKSDENLVEYANPVGVIFAVVPITNPIPNSLFKILHAIKTRNSIIFSYPTKSRKFGAAFIEDLRKILTSFNLPKNLLQTVPLGSTRSDTQKFMSHSKIDLVLATGGSELVNAAYSSGNPSFGVGPGNASTMIMPDADIDTAASMIIDSKAYDNGIVCGSENNLVVAKQIYLSFSNALEKHHAAVLTEEERERFANTIFDQNQQIRREFYGKPATEIAALCDITRPFPIKIFVFPTDENNDWLIKEKLIPLLAMLQSSSDDAIELGHKLLVLGGGVGHTASIFTHDPQIVEKFAETMPAGRLLINTPATFGMMGASTYFPLSFMLGSGTWGKNITTEAITWRHFVNIKRLSHHAKDVKY